MRCKDGTVFPADITSGPAELGDRKFVVRVFRDITERKLAELKLREMVALLTAFIRNSPIYSYVKEVTPAESRVLYASENFEQMVGVKGSDMEGKTMAELFPAEFAAKITADDWAVVSKGEVLTLDEDLNDRNYTTVKAPITIGSKTLLVGHTIDITGRKRAEEEKARLQQQLLHAQRLESVGRLAGGVAHDFNNMLGVILGHADLALKKSEPTQPLFADLKAIRKAAERSADLTRQLLSFARKQTIAPKVLDLNETVAGALALLQPLIGENIRLTWLPKPDLWSVHMDPSQVEQILANLCVNARDAIAGVGKITIETGNVTLDDDYCARHAGFVPGEYVRLVVSDDGCGMGKEALAHLFEPFFTTKGVGRGTGLGLATVYGIVKQNNGFINVYSEPGQGTTLTIRLPRHLGKTVEKQADGGPKPRLGGRETILLVEDEPAILNVTTEMLKALGYTVVAAGTPGEALRLARERAGEIHLLLTDVVMPEMNGRDLARNLLSLYPNIKRLFMSGYTADVIAHHGVLEEGVHFIQKPFSLTGLAAGVREALED